MARSLKVETCFRLDDTGQAVFSVTAFIRVNRLRDDPRLRMVIMEELRALFPDIRILEELN